MAPLSAKPQGAGPSVLPLKHNWAQITGHSHLKTDCPKKVGAGWTRTNLAVKWGAYASSLGKPVSTPRPHAFPSELLLVYYLIPRPECCKQLTFSLGWKSNRMLVLLFALEAKKHGYMCSLTEKKFPGSRALILHLLEWFWFWKVKKLQIIWWKRHSTQA